MLNCSFFVNMEIIDAFWLFIFCAIICNLYITVGDNNSHNYIDLSTDITNLVFDRENNRVSLF